MNNKIKTIHISIGDPSGIGPEIVVKALKSLKEINSIFVIHSNKKVLEKSSLQSLDFIKKDYSSEITEAGIYIKEIDSPIDFELGKISKIAGKIAGDSITSACKSCKKGDFLITAPINKEALNLAGFHYQGHTEMLEDLTKSKEVFMSFFGVINTLLLTTHIPLKDVITRIASKDFVYNKILNSYEYIKQILGEDVRAVIAGLNPHAGENGLMGDEEFVIIDALKRLESEHNIKIDGPLPSDTLFATYLTGKYNFVYSLYHDQALIPVKTFFMDKSLNMTLGLPFIRVSPDHGTAFDIAGTDCADYKPMLFCIDFINKLS